MRELVLAVICCTPDPFAAEFATINPAGRNTSMPSRSSCTTRENLKVTNDILEASHHHLSNFISRAFDELEHSESYLHMIEILIHIIHASRAQNWEEFWDSLRSILPRMQIYDNNECGRWRIKFWLQMNCLPEEKA